jgi:hypothetical protein
MKRIAKLFLLPIIFFVCPAAAADWQVVLLKPRDCNPCVYVEEMLKRSGQLREVTLNGGADGSVTAKIARRNSSELTPQEWNEIRALPYFREPTWQRKVAADSALVLLKRDSVIVSAGDIADSADIRNSRLPPELAQPDTQENPLAVRDARSKFLADVFLRSWNLDWFYRLALDPTLTLAADRPLDSLRPTGTLVPALSTRNVMLMSTASSASDNEIFNALRIEEIRTRLTESIGTPTEQVRVFYGGENPHGANALEVREGRFSLVRRDVEGATSFTPNAVQSIFASIRARPGSRNLLVLIGHGAPEGAGMWSSLTPLAPSALRSLHEQSGGDNVLVSGNCFGGVMARATSCGFFGARPDIVATGCQADAAEVAQSRDYLHTFFSAIAPGAIRLVDANKDGVVSFAEAHWYAGIEGDVRNVPYTTIDALADAWFESRPDAQPRTLAVKDILDLAKSAPAAESRTITTLLAGYDTKYSISLENIGQQSEKWTPSTGSPRPLVGQLARRLLFLNSSESKNSEASTAIACENRSIAAFLKP